MGLRVVLLIISIAIPFRGFSGSYSKDKSWGKGKKASGLAEAIHLQGETDTPYDTPYKPPKRGGGVSWPRRLGGPLRIP